MRRLVWKKAEAKKALEAIAADLAYAFGIPAPAVIIPDYLEPREWEWRIETLEVWTKAGRAECNVTISDRFAHLYFRFDDPARAVRFDTATDRLNRFSGKWNAIACPDSWSHNGKPDAAVSLGMFRAERANDFRRVAEQNPPADEVAAYRAKEAEQAARWAAMRDEVAA